MKIFLTLSDGSGKKSFMLKPTPVVLGRSQKNDIQITDPLCSGTHCQVFFEAGSVYIEDLNSKNGTFLNGTKIKKAKFYMNDTIAVGQSSISLDKDKMDNGTVEKLTSGASTGAPHVGGPTLEIESVVEVRQRVVEKKQVGQSTSQEDFVKKSKLYTNPNDSGDEPVEDADFEAKIKKANLIDKVVTVAVALAPFAYLLVTKNKDFQRFMSSHDPEIIFKTDLIYFFFGAPAISVIFSKINKSMKSGSVGEKIAGVMKQ